MIQEVGSQELVLNEPAEAAAPPVEGTLEGRLHATNPFYNFSLAVAEIQCILSVDEDIPSGWTELES